MGHRMSNDDERYAVLMVSALRSVQDNYFQQIYDGSEMDSYEHMAKKLAAFLERADQTATAESLLVERTGTSPSCTSATFAPRTQEPHTCTDAEQGAHCRVKHEEPPTSSGATCS